MAWLHVINGASITVNGSYKQEEEISNDSDFKDFILEVLSAGLYTSMLTNTEEDNLTVFLGKEILEDRHLYTGQTSTLDPELTLEEKELVEELSQRLRQILLKPSLNLELSETRFGIILSLFD